MVAAALVDQQIADARELVNALDEAGIEVDVALGLFAPERGAWKHAFQVWRSGASVARCSTASISMTPSSFVFGRRMPR